jgi:hypothetical protein
MSHSEVVTCQKAFVLLEFGIVGDWQFLDDKSVEQTDESRTTVDFALVQSVFALGTSPTRSEVGSGWRESLVLVFHFLQTTRTDVEVGRVLERSLDVFVALDTQWHGGKGKRRKEKLKIERTIWGLVAISVSTFSLLLYSPLSATVLLRFRRLSKAFK